MLNLRKNRKANITISEMLLVLLGVVIMATVITEPTITGQAIYGNETILNESIQEIINETTINETIEEIIVNETIQNETINETAVIQEPSPGEINIEQELIGYGLMDYEVQVAIIDSIVLNSTFGTNYTTENLIVYFNGTNLTTNITNWYVNGSPIYALRMPFEGGSNNTFTRDYALENNGTVTNAIWSPNIGVQGFGAYNFTGSAWITLNEKVQPLNLTSSFSYGAWFKINTLYPFRGVMARSKQFNLFDGYRLETGTQLGTYCMTGKIASTKFAISNSDPVAGQWYHAICVHNGTHLLLYMNGVLQNHIESVSTIGDAQANMTIGASSWYAPNDYRFSGVIDEANVWNKALTSEEILALYNNRTDLIVSEATEVGDIWYAEVTPNNGTQDGTKVQSNNITILESLITIPNLINITTDKLTYAPGETINFTAYWNNTDNVTTIIANNTHFTNCNYSTRTGCIINSTLTTNNPIVINYTTNQTTKWYAKACNENGCSSLEKTLTFNPNTNISTSNGSWYGESAGDALGRSVSSIGDFNGDGYADMIISGHQNDYIASGYGRAYLILGQVNGFSNNINISQANASWYGEENSGAGYSVSGAGDVNNDGYDDLLIGAFTYDGGNTDTGKTYLILGKASGFEGNHNLSQADASWYGEANSDYSSVPVSAAGDVNNDGYDDILISAYQNDYAGNRAGKTYLIFGKTSGWSNNINLSQTNASWYGEASDDDSGKSVTGVGDINGDGYDDIIIGANYNDQNGNWAGKAYLILGKATGWSNNVNLSQANASWYGEASDDQLGSAAAPAGDVNNDGYDDFIISADNNNLGGNDAGKTYLILGRTTGWTNDNNINQANASWYGEAADEYSGKSISSANDINGDGYDDILIGAIGNDYGGDSAGKTYLIYGKATGWTNNINLNQANASWYGENVTYSLGSMVTSAGDINGDGYPDLLIGNQYNDDVGANAGKTYLILADYTEGRTAGVISIREEIQEETILNYFNSTWNTSSTSVGSSNSTTIVLPLTSTGTYNFTVQWGDGNISNITSWNQAEVTHDYLSEGVYNILINGTIKGWRLLGGDRNKLLDISQWGDLQLGNEGSYFYGCYNFNSTATDTLNLTGTTNFSKMFYSARSFDGNINHWNTSNVTDMSQMFSGARNFSKNINNWDTSKVTNMHQMFFQTYSFNQPLNNWNTSSVTNMSDMFYFATLFNQSLNNWDTSNVKDMSRMFFYADSFNGNISSWDVSSVEDMGLLFSEASSFNQPLNNWNTSSVTRMIQLFYKANSFNQPLNNWNTSKVTNMRRVFWNAPLFNQDIGNWDVSKVTEMDAMFSGATAFNQDIGNWDVSSVIAMFDMFRNTVSFDQNLGNWDVSSVTNMNRMFDGITLSTQNYDTLLNGWGALTLQSNVPFNGGHSRYCIGQSARNDVLIGTYNWTITDWGKDANCNSDIDNSTIINSTIDNSTINNSYINNSYINNSYVDNSNVTNSTIDNSKIDNSQINDSIIENSTINHSDVEDSTIENSIIINANITNITLINSTVYNSTIDDSWFNNFTINNCTITESNLTHGTCDDSTIDDSDGTGWFVDPSIVIGSTCLGSCYVTDSRIYYSILYQTILYNDDINYSYINYTTANNSVIKNATYINITILDSNETISTQINGYLYVDPTYLENNIYYGENNFTNSTIINSIIEDSNITTSKINQSTINSSKLIDCDIQNCTIYNQVLYEEICLNEEFLYENNLSCLVVEGGCTGTYENYTDVLHLNNRTNAHAGLPNETNYDYSVCCKDLEENYNLTNSTGNNFLDLSDWTNAHVEYPNEVNYNYEAYLGAEGRTVTCDYPKTYGTCVGNTTCLVTLSTNGTNTSNLHVADCNNSVYETSVCCRITSLPIVQNIIITSDTQYGADYGNLTGNYSFFDGDGDNETANETRWYKNDAEIVSLRNLTYVDANNNTQGDRWIFSVRVNDGSGWSQWSNSSEFIINSQPNATTTLTSTDSLNSTNGDLIGSIGIIDLDNDPIRNNETKWYKETIEQGSLANLLIITSGNTTKGDNWTFSTRVWDGSYWSEWENKTIQIGNARPDFTNAWDNATIIQGGTNISINTTTSDIDGDTLTLYVCNTTNVNSGGCVDGQYCTATSLTNPNCILTSETDSQIHNWYAYVYDSEGLIALNNFTGNYNTDAESPRSEIILPTNNSIIGQNQIPYLITGNATDNNGITQVRININGSNYITAGTTDWNYTWTPTQDGIYILYSNSTDTLNNHEGEFENIYVQVFATSNISNSTIINSTKINSTIIDSIIIDSTNYNSTIIRTNETNSFTNDSTITDSTINDSTIVDSTKIDCIIRESEIINSINYRTNLTNTNETNSYINDTETINSEINNSIIRNSIINNCIIMDSTLDNIYCENGILTNVIYTNATIINSNDTDSTQYDGQLFIDPSITANNSYYGFVNITDSTVKNNEIHDSNITNSIVITNILRNTNVNNSNVSGNNNLLATGNTGFENLIINNANITNNNIIYGDVDYQNYKYQINSVIPSPWALVNIYAKCGDTICLTPNTCGTTNNYAKCNFDCNTCPLPPGGSGGGIGRRLSICSEQWNCTGWGECLPNGTQERNCYDLNRCDEQYNQRIISYVNASQKPEETRTCEYAACDPECEKGYLCVDNKCELLETCNDGIKNQNEEEIDCGGECEPCITEEKPLPTLLDIVDIVRRFVTKTKPLIKENLVLLKNYLLVSWINFVWLILVLFLIVGLDRGVRHYGPIITNKYHNHRIIAAENKRRDKISAGIKKSIEQKRIEKKKAKEMYLEAKRKKDLRKESDEIIRQEKIAKAKKERQKQKIKEAIIRRDKEILDKKNRLLENERKQKTKRILARELEEIKRTQDTRRKDRSLINRKDKVIHAEKLERRQTIRKIKNFFGKIPLFLSSVKRKQKYKDNHILDKKKQVMTNEKRVKTLKNNQNEKENKLAERRTKYKNHSLLKIKERIIKNEKRRKSKTTIPLKHRLKHKIKSKLQIPLPPIKEQTEKQKDRETEKLELENIKIEKEKSILGKLKEKVKERRKAKKEHKVKRRKTRIHKKRSETKKKWQEYQNALNQEKTKQRNNRIEAIRQGRIMHEDIEKKREQELIEKDKEYKSLKHLFFQRFDKARKNELERLQKADAIVKKEEEKYLEKQREKRKEKAKEAKEAIKELRKLREEREKQEQLFHEQRKAQYTKQIAEYVETSVRKYLSKGDIKKGLVKQGWPKAYVNKYVNKYFKVNKQQIKQIKKSFYEGLAKHYDEEIKTNKQYLKKPIETKPTKRIRFKETKFEYEQKIKVDNKKLEKLQKLQQELETKKENTKQYLAKELPKKWWKKTEIKKKVELTKFEYEPEIKTDNKKLEKLNKMLEKLNSELNETGGKK